MPFFITRPPAFLRHIACLGTTALFLAACSSEPLKPGAEGSFLRHFAPYRIDVRQGNEITPDMLGRLKPGMSKDQIRFLLGTPLLIDPFHADRWDYLYRLETGLGKVSQTRLTLFFKADVLDRYTSDLATPVATADAATDATASPAPKPATRIIDITSPAESK